MPETQFDFIFTFNPTQRERFRDGSLAQTWHQKYPELFDDDDVRILMHQRKYHFFEWLSAILLFEATGCVSLVEGYIAKSHPRKRAVLQDLVPPRVFEWMDRNQSGQPDLFVYRPATRDWFVCEVKGGQDRVRKNQRAWVTGFNELLHREQISLHGRVRIIHLHECGP